MKTNYLWSVISIVLILLSISCAYAQTSHASSNLTTNLSSSFNHTLAIEKQVRQYDLNDTQTIMAVKLATNATQFQSLIRGYNYSFDGIFEYFGPTMLITQNYFYAVDFSLYKGPVSLPLPTGVATVWLDPKLKLLDVTSSGMGWIGKSEGPVITPEIASLCYKSFACYLRFFSIPQKASSICDTTLGCYVVGSKGSSIHLTSLSDSSSLQPPLKQLKKWKIDKYHIECKTGLQLINKREDGSPACVTLNTFGRLLALQWGFDPLKQWAFDGLKETYKMSEPIVFGVKYQGFNSLCNWANVVVKHENETAWSSYCAMSCPPEQRFFYYEKEWKTGPNSDIGNLVLNKTGTYSIQVNGDYLQKTITIIP
jgi:hypothetical protein